MFGVYDIPINFKVCVRERGGVGHLPNVGRWFVPCSNVHRSRVPTALKPSKPTKQIIINISLKLDDCDHVLDTSDTFLDIHVTLVYSSSW